jgi:Lar family restriction alleviation protein
MSVLKPCPFCGFDACLEETEIGAWSAYCPACDAKGPGIVDETRSEIIAAWNTRAPDPAVSALWDEIRWLRAVLEPFAKGAAAFTGWPDSGETLDGIKVSAWRAAQQAYSSPLPDPPKEGDQ